MKYNLFTDIPVAIREFYQEITKSEATGNSIEEAFTYTDENNAEQTGLRQVPEYIDVVYIEQINRPEIKSIQDLERIIALGKNDKVLTKFAAMVEVGNQWSWFDKFNEVLQANLDRQTLIDEHIPEFDGDGVEILLVEPLIIDEPVRPLAKTDDSILLPYYKERRRVLYPDLSDFADAFVKSKGGNNSDMDAYIIKCNDVKTKVKKV